MRKLFMCALFLIAFVGIGLITRPTPVHAATAWQTDYWNHECAIGAWGSGCKGYFTGKIPGCIPNDCNDYRVISNGVNANGIATGCGAGTACADFISIIQSNLNSSNGEVQDTCGAAFVIDAMMGHAVFNSSCAAGIAAAKGYFNSWKALVASYASSTNSAYGVQWNVLQNPTINSGFFANNPGYPNNIIDDVSYANDWHCTPLNGCGGAFRDDATTGWVWKEVDVPIPTITFYFPGGTFIIERGCSNLVGTTPKLPPVSQSPVGTISLSCDTTTQQQVATIVFSDPEAATTAYIQTGSWTSGVYDSPGPANITIPQSVTNPYTSQGVALFVKDTGSGGSQAYQQVATANTSVPCAQFSCGSVAVTPSRVDPYSAFSMTVSVTNGVNQTPPGAQMTLAIAPPAGATYSYSGTQSAGGSGNVSTATFNGLGPTNSAGNFTLSWSLKVGATTKTCSDTFPVVYLPYMSVYGGDVMIGASPSSSSGACSMDSNQNGGIYGWNNHTVNFSGAGAQYAVQALAQIQDFASAQNSSSTAPSGLSIANYYNPPDGSKLDATQGLFGGYAGAASSDCDFTSDITTSPTTSDMTISGTTVNIGTQDIRYVKDADVYINGNIVYAGSNGGWTNVGQIPSFKLVVVGGNIYIGSNVTQLDGLFVAEPTVDSNGNLLPNGRIYTCATGIGAQADPTLPGYYTQCNKQLIVNGALIAAQVHFLRTYGSIGQSKITDTASSTHAGETINYTPELWLPRGTTATTDGYNAITGLPPVL
jgi:hypothetical protein